MGVIAVSKRGGVPAGPPACLIACGFQVLCFVLPIINGAVFFRMIFLYSAKNEPPINLAFAGTSGQMLKEGNAINLSLTALGGCIKSLAEGKKAQFRTSKLTLMLQVPIRIRHSVCSATVGFRCLSADALLVRTWAVATVVKGVTVVRQAVQ